MEYPYLTPFQFQAMLLQLLYKAIQKKWILRTATPIRSHTQPHSSMNCVFRPESLNSSISLANSIRINLYFLRVQRYVPLLHEPRFRQKLEVGDLGNEVFTRLSIEDALILTAMMALSARFSNNAFFTSKTPNDKGRTFARKATKLYAEALQSDAMDECSLSFLQGCVLLAFYQQTYESTTRGWLLIGTCCRLAIDLGLDMVDKDVQLSGMTPKLGEQDPAHLWSQKEEKRRTWWLVWELDVFAATVLRRPQAINNDQMHVLLPVSDALWFSDTPTESTFIQVDLFHTWQTLECCPNADERAWFLVTSFLMARAANLASPQCNLTLQDILNFESTLNCFALLLPESFHLDFMRTPFDEGNFPGNNWILLTIFMLHRYVYLWFHPS